MTIVWGRHALKSSRLLKNPFDHRLEDSPSMGGEDKYHFQNGLVHRDSPAYSSPPTRKTRLSSETASSPWAL